MKILHRIESLAKRLAILNDSVRLRKRALAFFSIIIFFPMIVILALYFRYSTGIIEQEVSVLTQRSLGQVKSNLDYRFNNVAETSLTIMNTLYSYLNRNSNDASLRQQMDDFSAMNRLFSAYDGRYMIHKFRLFISDDIFYANQQDTFYPMSLLEKKDLYKQMFSNGKRVFWEQTHRFLGKYYGDDRQIISCVTMLASSDDYSKLASVLYVDILEQEISEILDIGINYGESVFLIDSSGTIVSHKDKQRIGEQSAEASRLSSILSNQSGFFSIRSPSGEILVSFEKLSGQDWYVVAEVPKTSIYGSVFHSFGFMSGLTMIMVLALLALALVLLFSMVMESAISRVNQATLQIEKKGMEDIIGAGFVKSREFPTISSLETHVDHLVKTIASLMEESYKAQIANREAQLKALQSQINPHFLYNTLDTIKWMVLSGDTDMSVWMVNSLSRYFRLSLNKGKDIVPLQDEVNLVITYLHIQQKRFQNIFEVKTHFEPEALGYLAPKLLLQPIVENALYHGVRKKKDRNGIIDIRIEMAEGDIIAEISDNGEGMSEEEIENILQRKQYGKGYGIMNVDERIKLYCGADYGISIYSSKGRGTTVSMRLRAIKLPDTPM